VHGAQTLSEIPHVLETLMHGLSKNAIRVWRKRLEEANRDLLEDPRNFRAMAIQGAALYWLNEAIFSISVGGQQK
jgi:uncharacterized protein involved in copper resistance